MSLTLAVMQPYIFPYLGYFQLIKAVDLFVFYDDVNFINKGWVNRNRILVGGSDNLFTIPLQSASQNSLIKDIHLSNEAKWKDKLIKTIEFSYKKAPHFDKVFPLISDILFSDSITISDLATLSIKECSAFMGIKTPFKYSSESYNNTNLKGQHRILDICIQEKANRYINPIGGQEIYSRELFKENRIDLFFIKSGNFIYPQFKNTPVQHLSIIDVLMFNDTDTLCAALENYELI